MRPRLLTAVCCVIVGRARIELVRLVKSAGLLFLVLSDSNLDVSALLELHIIAMFIS
jgi:hypothetical protein